MKITPAFEMEKLLSEKFPNYDIIVALTAECNYRLITEHGDSCP